ncbi:hypothetical protein RIF29_32204 [Crotalaria pallida]|uniref:Uncharacterized protein n=1 Tax=Crotalaria pallida TaxID=3830 RepID=A0AAN9EII3_CROPI
MNPGKACTVLNLVAVVILCVAMLMSYNNQSGVDASRVLLSSDSQDFARANHLQTYTTTSLVYYEQAKNTMSFWLQRLASGPSRKGPGH